MIDKEFFARCAAEYGFDLTAQQLEQFDLYAKLLVEWNEKMNLTAITQPRDIVIKHFLDSILALKAVELPQGASLVDVGSGAGFPSVPMLILRPDLKLTLLDSLNKRVDWLNEVSAQLGLSNVQAIHARAEEKAQGKGFRDSFDFATARAVAELRLLCELCLPYVKVGGYFLSMKSGDSDKELEDAAHCIKFLGGRVAGVHDYTIPGTDVSHRLVVIQKVAPTLKGYPRRWANMQKKPL